MFPGKEFPPGRKRFLTQVFAIHKEKIEDVINKGTRCSELLESDGVIRQAEQGGHNQLNWARSVSFLAFKRFFVRNPVEKLLPGHPKRFYEFSQFGTGLSPFFVAGRRFFGLRRGY